MMIKTLSEPNRRLVDALYHTLSCTLWAGIQEGRGAIMPVIDVGEKHKVNGSSYVKGSVAVPINHRMYKAVVGEAVEDHLPVYIIESNGQGDLYSYNDPDRASPAVVYLLAKCPRSDEIGGDFERQFMDMMTR